MKIFLQKDDPRYEQILQTKFTDEETQPYILVCNKCEKEVTMSHQGDYWSENLMHSFVVGFGYGSRYDMDTWDFHLCEKCLLSLVFSFALPPNGHHSYPSKEEFSYWVKQERLPYLLEED